MKNITALILLMILKVGLSQVIANIESEVKETLKFLQQGDERITSSDHSDIVYVVGPTGTGKSTLVHLLAGEPSLLRSIEIDEDSDDFIIEHISEDKIGNVTLQSKTIYPDLIIDEHNIPYYDCPGFSDTRKTSIEIATTYFTKKAIGYAERLKIIFVVNWSSMLKGYSSRNDFLQFVKHATEFLQNVELYRDGIILIASKVPVTKGKRDSDERLINKVRGFLKEHRQSRFEDAQGNESQTILNELKLIDTFLINGRIGLFKRPTTSRLLSEIPEVMENRVALSNSINQAIDFVKMNEEDFGYTLSDRSKIQISALAEAINNKITTTFGDIGQQVIDFYSNDYYENNDDLKGKFNNVIEVLSKISPNISISEYLVSVNQLCIPTLQSNLLNIKNHIDYMEFLQGFDDKPIVRRTSDWSQALQNCLKYLSTQRNWYSFADLLLHRLSEFEVQRNTSKYDVANVERWGLGDSNTENGIFVTHANFKNFLSKSLDFYLVENIEATKSKIDLLNNILNATLKSKHTVTCHDHTITVKGNFVKFSDLEEIACPGARLIEVFGLSTIFVDMDLKKNVDLVMIAPKWYVHKTETKISLDGVNGRDGKDAFQPSTKIGSEYLNGAPGMPGGNANHFFGYGEEFINSELLYISAVGGDGGRGQNGFSGVDGQENTQMVSQSDHSDMGFLFFDRQYWTDQVYRSYHHCPGINGMGGAGGFGGFGGVIELNNISGIQISTKSGKDGSHGYPGKCGKTYDKIEMHKTTHESCVFWLICSTEVSWTPVRHFKDETCLKYCLDSTLVNLNGIARPVASKLPNSAHSVGQYKSFVRENIYTIPLNQKRLSNFLQSIEQNSKIRAIYDCKAFIDDFFQMEKQFHLLNNKHISLDFYQSLNQRILEFASGRSDDLQANERNVLANLYTAGLSKICQLRSGTEQNLIINIESYLEVAMEHIRLIEKNGKRVAINKFKNEYRQNLETKIADNHAFITREIWVEIEKLNSQIDSDVESLLDKVLEAKNSVSMNIDQYNRAKMELGQSINTRGIFTFLKIVAEIASFFDGFAMVSKTVNSVNRIANDAFTLAHHNRKPSEKLFYTPSDESKDIYTQLKNSAQSSKQRKSRFILNIVEEILTMAARFSFDDISEPLMKTKNILSGDKRVDLTNDEIDLLHENVQNVIRNKTDEVKRRNETNSLSALEKISKKLSVLQKSVDLFGKFSSDVHKLEEIEAVLSHSQDKFMELNHFERNFRQFVDPIVKHMQRLFDHIPEMLTDQTTSSEMMKWYIESTLKDFRFRMQNIGGDALKFKSAFLHIFDKLDGAFSILINVYDRIQIYEEQAELSNYIANIESADYSVESNLTNPDLDKLNGIIKSNVLLTIFNNALNGFKQTIFPFADFYLRRFDLPHQLETDTSSESMVNKATKELISLKLTLKEYRSASINKNDNLIHTADFSSEFKSSQPFYVWTGNSNYETIAKLLSGKKVTVKADITKGLKWNAVKFQYLEIHLKSSNQTNQSKLDNLLQYFDVTMVHHGNSYYRCDNKFYLITSPIQRIQYSFEKDTNGLLSIRRNNVYDKMRNGDFTLSPYALFTINLTARRADDFKLLNAEFIRNVDLELIGRGQYVNPNIDACVGLEKYYAADEIVYDFHDTSNFFN